jgi:hypothetical protein
MHILDSDWRAELFTELGGRICGSFFVGADGRVYKEGRYRDQNHRASYTIDVLKQRWYVCPGCQYCFLGAKLMPTPVFKASSGMRQAIKSIRQDPNAGPEMEARSRCAGDDGGQ